jgi:hypothetical protein
VLCVSIADVSANADSNQHANARLDVSANVQGTTEAWTLAQAGLTGAELAYRKRFRPQPVAGPTPSPRVFPNVAELVERLRADGVLAQKG